MRTPMKTTAKVTRRWLLRDKVKPYENVEECVLCHQTLPIPKVVSVQERLYYVYGAGQLCPKCYEKVHSDVENIE